MVAKAKFAVKFGVSFTMFCLRLLYAKVCWDYCLRLVCMFGHVDRCAHTLNPDVMHTNQSILEIKHGSELRVKRGTWSQFKTNPTPLFTTMNLTDQVNCEL